MSVSNVRTEIGCEANKNQEVYTIRLKFVSNKAGCRLNDGTIPMMNGLPAE